MEMGRRREEGTDGPATGTGGRSQLSELKGDSGRLEVPEATGQADGPAAARLARKSSSELRWFREQRIGALRCMLRVAAEGRPDVCGCGLLLACHDEDVQDRVLAHAQGPWTIAGNTARFATNAFGVLHFQGRTTQKAPFARMALDTEPEKVLQLLMGQWELARPKLLISVMGSTLDVAATPELEKTLTSGLFKAAKATDTWVLANGLGAGVSALLGDLIGEHGKPEDLRLIGICPWGLVKSRLDMEHQPSEEDPPPVIYRPKAHSLAGKTFSLHPNYDAFLLADDGTYGEWGGEQFIRQGLEDAVAAWKLEEGRVKSLETPVVGLLVGGGPMAFRRLRNFVRRGYTVVVMGGSGGLADLICLAHAGRQEEMRRTLRSLAAYDNPTRKLEGEICRMVDKMRDVFIIHQQEESRPVAFPLASSPRTGLDRSIFKAAISLPPRQKINANQWKRFQEYRTLKLCMAWDRVDIAQELIFKSGQYYADSFMHTFAKEALRMDRCNFMELLLANSLSLQHLLTPDLLLDLYNLPAETVSGRFFYDLASDVLRKEVNGDGGHRLGFRMVGQLLEHLLGHGYTSTYTSEFFQGLLDIWRANHPPGKREQGNQGHEEQQPDLFFQRPSNDLLVWAVLRNRLELAKMFASRGEDSLAKCLIANKLYATLASEASLDLQQHGLASQLRDNADYFGKLAMDLVEAMWQRSAEKTCRLLTSSLTEWGCQTSLSLAVMAEHHKLVAHPASQSLLDDLWKGGLNERQNINPKVVAGIFCPLLVPFLKYKTLSEIKQQAQTAAELVEQDLMDEWISRGGGDPAVVSRREDLHAASRRTVLLSRARSFNNVSPAGRTQRTQLRSAAGAEPDPNDPAKEEASSFLSSLFGRSRTSQRQASDLPTDQTQSGSWPSGDGSTGAALPQTSSDKMGILPRFREFYSAPITRYWLHFISFLLFLTAHSWMMLMPTDGEMGLVELYVAAYVGALAADLIILKTIMLPKSLLAKLRMFSGWECYRVACILVYLAALNLRCGLEPWRENHQEVAEHSRPWGRVLHAVNLVMWFINLLGLMYVFRRLGVYTSIMLKMLVKMVPLLSVLMVVLTAFGLAVQGIRVPHRQMLDGTAFRDVFFHPYFMLYGEVYAAEIDPCGDKAEEGEFKFAACTTGHWVVPILLSIFLVIANITIINLLIAVFNDVFNEMMAVSEETWSFGRYGVVLEYEGRATLPPPLSVVQNVARLVKTVLRGLDSDPYAPDIHLDFTLRTRPGPVEEAELGSLEERSSEAVAADRRRREREREEPRSALRLSVQPAASDAPATAGPADLLRSVAALNLQLQELQRTVQERLVEAPPATTEELVTAATVTGPTSASDRTATGSTAAPSTEATRSVSPLLRHLPEPTAALSDHSDVSPT